MNSAKEDNGPATASLIERRKHRRISICIPVRITSAEGMRKNFDEGICSNISEDGATFETTADLNLSEVVDLEFLQKGDPVLRRKARLLYRFGQKYGAYFL